MQPEAPRPHQTLGILAPLLGGFYFGGLISGIHQRAQEVGARVFAVQTLGEDSGVPLPFTIPLAWNIVDGWIVILDTIEHDYLRQIQAHGKPIVSISAQLSDLGCPAVMPDNHGGSYAATKHLLEHGHSSIAFVGWLEQNDIRERYEGYCAALAEHGLEPDPALIFPVRDNLDDGGRDAAARLLAAGLPYTAVVAATDMTAMGLIWGLQEAGKRVPDEVAVVGFDDVEAAPYLTPPLSSVRQRIDVIGKMAADLVLEQLAGREVSHGPHYIPTMLIPRRSCGCKPAALAAVSASPDGKQAVAWQETLLRQLTQLAVAPMEPDPQINPEQVWPGMGKIIQMLEAVLSNGQSLPDGDLKPVWRAAIRLAPSHDKLHEIINLLRHTGSDLLARAPAAPEARARLDAFLDQASLDLMHAWQEMEWSRHTFLDSTIEHNYRVNMSMLGTQHESAKELQWLRWTPLQWGALGLWDAADAVLSELVVVGSYSTHGAPAPPLESRYAAAAFPPLEFLPSSTLSDGPNVVALIPVRTTYHDWGVLALVGAPQTSLFYGIGTMGQWAAQLSATLEREALLSSLERQQSELRAAKAAAEKANELKTQFLASMSHELRTPLNAILNFTRFMGDPEISGASLNDHQKLFQHRVLSSSEHLLGLINDILDISKIEAGKMELAYEEFELLPILRGISSTAVGLIQDKEIELRLDVGEGLPLAWGDKTRIRQVLLNLLSNAVKFTPQGSITVRARQHEAGLIEIAVQDTGIGIAQEHQLLIFEAFRQVQSDLSREYQGTGLGLPICKKLVELHGGTMWLESEAGQGATFSFTMPISPRMRAELADQPPTTLGGPLILVVDDSPDSQRILRHMLEHAGYSVYGLLDSRDALAKIHTLQPALVILDVLMPSLNGWEVLSQIRSDPEVAAMPVVFCSVMDDERLGILYGINGYIPKPVHEEELLQTVRTWVGAPATVMVVDDDANTHEIIRTLLESKDIRVVEAYSGGTALELLAQARPDLVILDLMMPGIDGFETLERLRATPGLEQLPVVVLSAKDLDSTERQWLVERAQSFVQKTAFSQDEFSQLIRSLLQKGEPHASGTS